jgi:hypothetical protein
MTESVIPWETPNATTRDTTQTLHDALACSKIILAGKRSTKLRKRRKIRISRKASKRRRIKIRRAKRPEAKARKRAIRVLSRATDPPVARALGLMRREGAQASAAAREERIKLHTLRKHAGRYLFRSGPGNPWKARSEDQLRFSMTVLTGRGPLDVVVPNSRERKLLNKYNFALRMFRAGEDGADAALRAFEMELSQPCLTMYRVSRKGTFRLVSENIAAN